MSDFSAIPFPLQFDTLHSFFTPSVSSLSSSDSDYDTDYSFEPNRSDYAVSLLNSVSELDLNAEPMQLDLNVEPPLFDLNAEPPRSDLNAEPPQFSHDFDCWGFENTNIYDEIQSYMEDFGSPVDVNTGSQEEANTGGLRIVGIDSDSDSEVMHMNIGDDDFYIWENYVLSDLATEEERWNQYENLVVAMEDADQLALSSLTISALGGAEEEDSNMNVDWEQELPINDHVDVDESILEFLFDVDFTPTERGGRSSAARMVVENLPLVNLRKEDMVVCAICRDEMGEGEIVNRLPCSHYYHRDCIVPWLEIKNNCPVCRFELPTDDRGTLSSRMRGLELPSDDRGSLSSFSSRTGRAFGLSTED